MTAKQIDTMIDAHQVGERVQIRRKGHSAAGRISSIHRSEHGVEYVVHTDPVHRRDGQRAQPLDHLGSVLVPQPRTSRRR